MMKARLNESKAEKSMEALAVQETALACGGTPDNEINVSLLEDSLAKTPWERMQANDDALRFADSLRAAMQERNAKAFSVNPKSSEHCLAGSPELLEPAILIP